MRTLARPAVGAAAEGPVDAEFEEDQSQALAVRPPGSTAIQQRTQYSTAVHVPKPRDLTVLTKKVLQEAELSGEDFFYSWTTRSREGDKIVEGPSIDAAMILVRNFGNTGLETNMVEDTPSHWLFDAVFVDLETGFTLKRQFRQRKGEAHQKKGNDADRLLDIAFQIGQSKAQRNVIVKAMPGWLVRKAMEEAKKAADANYAGKLPDKISEATVAFGKLGVSIDDLEKKLGKPTAAWTISDCRVLSGLHRGIQAHETSVDNEFRPPPGVTGPAPAAGPNPQPVAGAPAQQPVGAQPPPAAAPPAQAPPAASQTEARKQRAREPGEEG